MPLENEKFKRRSMQGAFYLSKIAVNYGITIRQSKPVILPAEVVDDDDKDNK